MAQLKQHPWNCTRNIWRSTKSYTLVSIQVMNFITQNRVTNSSRLKRRLTANKLDGGRGRSGGGGCFTLLKRVARHLSRERRRPFCLSRPGKCLAYWRVYLWTPVKKWKILLNLGGRPSKSTLDFRPSGRGEERRETRHAWRPLFGLPWASQPQTMANTQGFDCWIDGDHCMTQWVIQ